MPIATNRRAFLAGMTAVPFAARAQPAAIPVVDELTLTILDDKETFGPFLPDQMRPGLSIRYAGNGGSPADGQMRKRALTGEFGLSILASSRLNAEQRRMLVDFGYSPEVLANNMTLLGIDPATIDASVLSHGHLDHYGGFPALSGSERKRGRKLPLYVGGEETFCERIAMIGTPPPRMGVLDRAALAAAGYDVRVAARPVALAGHGFTTGTIPLETFERAAIPTKMHPGVGCERGLLSPAKRDQAELADDGEHELASFYLVRGRGLVVIASCSHRGVLNSIRRAQVVSGETRLHMVIGGFHLVRPRTDEEARRTARDLAAMNPAYVVPMHCTGETFIAEAIKIMPDKVIRPYVGMNLII